MSELRSQIRAHYEAQSLPAAKAEAIVERGRAAAAGREPQQGDKIAGFRRAPRFARIVLAAAAAILVFSGLAGLWTMKSRAGVPFAALAPGLIEFFAHQPKLEKGLQDKAAVRAWLLAQGAPGDFQIPTGLLPLESFACAVVDVDGKKTYLSCYWREQRAGRGDHELIHLLLARRSDFRGGPESPTPAMRELDGWSFASWANGDVLYTLATPAPIGKLEPFLPSQERVAFAGPPWQLPLGFTY